MNANPKTAGKGIRTGAQYLTELQDDRDVWLRGEKVKDVTSHPTLSRGAKTLASFLDKQFDPALQDKITYVEDDVRYAMSFKKPHKRRRHQTAWRRVLRVGNLVERNVRPYAGLQECLGDGLRRGRRFSCPGSPGIRRQHARLL